MSRHWPRQIHFKIATASFSLFKRFKHRYLRIPPKQIQLPINKLQQHHLSVWNHLQNQLIHIRQVITCGIHFPIIGVALIHHTLAMNPHLRCPSRQRGHPRCIMKLCACCTFAKIFIRGICVVFGMPLGKNVFGICRLIHPSQLFKQLPHRLISKKPNGIIIHLLKPNRFPICHKRRRHTRAIKWA